MFEPTEVEGIPIEQLYTSIIDEQGDQTQEVETDFTALINPWGGPHCLQSAVPRAVGFFSIMYMLTRVGRWKRARRRVSMVVYRGVQDIFFNTKFVISSMIRLFHFISTDTESEEKEDFVIEDCSLN